MARKFCRGSRPYRIAPPGSSPLPLLCLLFDSTAISLHSFAFKSALPIRGNSRHSRMIFLSRIFRSRLLPCFGNLLSVQPLALAGPQRGGRGLLGPRCCSSQTPFMKIIPLITSGVVLSSLLFFAISGRCQNSAFTYQGRLNASGNSGNGSYDLVFALYNDPILGSQQGAALTNTPCQLLAGLFTTEWISARHSLMDSLSGFRSWCAPMAADHSLH